MTTGRKIGRRGITLFYSLDTRLETIISSLVIILKILITFSLENVVTLLGQNRCCSLLGFKGLRQITTVVGHTSIITLGTKPPKLLPRAGTNIDLRLPPPALMIYRQAP